MIGVEVMDRNWIVVNRYSRSRKKRREERGERREERREKGHRNRGGFMRNTRANRVSLDWTRTGMRMHMYPPSPLLYTPTTDAVPCPSTSTSTKRRRV